MTAIRLSPSGPVIGNGNDPNSNQPGGAPLEPGPGMQLRLSEVSATTSLVLTAGAVEIGSGNGFRCELTDPNPGYNYRADCTLNLQSTSGAATARIILERSLDAGVTWTTVKSASFGIAATGQSRQAVMHAEMAIGSGTQWDIDNTGYASILLRATGELLAGTDASIVSPNGTLALYELF